MNGLTDPQVPDFDEYLDWPEWPDMLGRPVRPGDVVAYATRVGNSAEQHVGMVMRLRRRDAQGEELKMNALVNGKWTRAPGVKFEVRALFKDWRNADRWTWADRSSLVSSVDNIVKLEAV